MVRTRGATLNRELHREPDPSLAGAWLWQPRPLRHIGYAAYDYAFEFLGVLPLEFDGVIFIDRTQASSRLGLRPQ